RALYKLVGVKTQMVLHKRGYKVVAMVVVGMAAQRQRLASLLAGQLEGFRIQLLGQERVGQPLVDQNALRKGRAFGSGHEFAGVVLFPGLAVRPLVAAESLAPPGATGGRGGWCGRGSSSELF